MNDGRGRVLLFLSEDVLGQARVLAGQMTATLGLPVSLQVTLRALIEEGLKRKHRPRVADLIEVHAHAVRDARRTARQAPGRDGTRPRPGARGMRATT
jgi:hypothetical protein